MINQKNCINCAAPLNLSLNKCEYCFTPLNKIDIRLSQKAREQIIASNPKTGLEKSIQNNSFLIYGGAMVLLLMHKR